MAKKPEQVLWAHVDRIMGSMWKAQRHEDKYASDIPDVSYSCNGVNGWIELKVVGWWPQRDFPLTIPLTYFTPGQRNWLVARGKNGSGHCFMFARIGTDYVLMRRDQLHMLGHWTRDDWLWLGWGFWQRRLVARELAERLSSSTNRAGVDCDKVY